MSTERSFSTSNSPKVTLPSPDKEPPPLPPPSRIPKHPPQRLFNDQTYRPTTSQSVADLAVEVSDIGPDLAKQKPRPAPRTSLQSRRSRNISSDSDIRSRSSSVMITDLDQPPEEENGYLSSHHLPASSGSQSSLNSETSPSPDLSITRTSAQNVTSRMNSDLIKWESFEYLRSTKESLEFLQSEADLDPDVVVYTPPPYSPPPPPDDSLLFEVPPPLPPRPPRKETALDELRDRPILPLAVGSRMSIFRESETRNGVTTLRSGSLTFRQNRCWCVLKDGKFSLYAERKAISPPKLVVSCVDILEISADKKNLLSFGFELSSVKEKNRSFTFLTESSDERNHWLQALAKCICDVLAMHATTLKVGRKEFEIAGRMHVRHGTTGRWVRSWIELSGRTLQIFTDEEDDECDLRKVVSFNVVNVAFYEKKSAAVCPDAAENSNPFIVSMPGRVLYFQAETEKSTTSWMKLMQQRARECGNAIEDQPMTAEDVPVVVQKCIEFVCAHGLKTEGIYRHSGVSSRIASVLDIFTKDAHGCHLSKENFSEHDVAGALKRFLRNLPEPLIKLELYQPLLHCSEIEDVPQKLLKYQSLLEQLPNRPNYVTLKKLLGHLKVVAEFATDNKMSIPNIASSFGSTLMSGSMDSSTVDSLAGSNFSGSTKEITVLVDFLTFYEMLFVVTEEELQKERKIINAVESINKQLQSPPRAGDFLMGVYWIDRKGEAVNMRIKMTLTAGELCRSLMNREKMEPDAAYALHEVIFDDKLCRPIPEGEEVIPIILRWTQWNEANICPYSSNYLCVKKNDLFDKIAPLIRSPIAVFQQLRLSKKKSFKKIALDFSQMNLTCFENLSAEKIMGVWRMEDIVWFRGCSPNRSPPSKWTFTFIEKNNFLDRHKENRTAFGYTVCCDEELDLIKWISALVQAQQSLTKYSSTRNGSST